MDCPEFYKPNWYAFCELSVMENHGTIGDMAKTVSVMVSFVGNRDPYPENDEFPGPILSFLLQHPVDKTYRLCSSTEYLEPAQDSVHEAQNEGILTRFFRK